MIRHRTFAIMGLITAISACGQTKEAFDTHPVSDNEYRPGDFDVDNGEQNPQCPSKDTMTGLNTGDTFPSVQYPNAEWEPVSIKSLCGNRAILVISATEWCTGCLVEFDYLASVGSDWASRGVGVYYTIFENSAGQPATRGTLIKFEEYMEDIYGSVPFRMLADRSATLPRSLNGRVNLPLAWALDPQMVITNFSEGSNSAMITEWVEELLDRPDASPIF